MKVHELVTHLAKFPPDCEVQVNIPEDIAVPEGSVLHLNIDKVESFAPDMIADKPPVVINLGDTAYSSD